MKRFFYWAAATILIFGIGFTLVYISSKKGSDEEIAQKLYDPEFLKKKWQTENGVLYVTSSDGKRYAVRHDFADGFEGVREGARGLSDLINDKRQWTSVTLQSASAPDVASYVALQKSILAGGDFVEARVEPSSTRAHLGEQSLHMLTPKGSHVLSKASIQTVLAHFVKGDDFWYSAWYYLEKGTPLTLMDLEASYIEGGPGFRIFIGDTLRPGVELKWGNKPTFYATDPLPRNTWVNIKLHLKLSEKQDGRAELWVDGRSVLEKQMQTLPFAGIVLDRVEVGLSASPANIDTELYMDDVHFSKEEII